MAMIPTDFYRGAAATSNSTLYNTSYRTIVTNIAVVNTAATAATFTISLDGVEILAGPSIGANTTAFFDLKQVVTAGKTITGFASASTVKFHISGIEEVI